MEDRNYNNQIIGQSGVAETEGLKSPLQFATDNYASYDFDTPLSVGDIAPAVKDGGEIEYIGDISARLNAGEDLGDIRADNQSGFEMAGNALINNLVITGTTAISGTLGLVDGIFSAISEGDASKLWDNSVNNWATDTQNSFAEDFPIYRGKSYEESSLGSKLTSGIFWADMVQNLGYTQGMMIPGMGVSSLLSKSSKVVQALAPSLVASIGEASQEAVRSKNDEIDNKSAMALQRYNELSSNITNIEDQLLLDEEYKQTISNIQEDANIAGNFVFGSNIALLTLTNAIEFGRTFSKGYSTAKRASNALKKNAQGQFLGESTTSAITKGIGRKLIDASSEGIEEVSQGIISNTPSLIEDYNSFNNSKFNPEKRELVSNTWQALGVSISEKMKDPNTGTEFASGFITGMLGVPMLRKGIVPIKLENNAYSEVKEYTDKAKRSRELAASINERLSNSTEVNSYYNGLVRNLALQDRMNLALENDDVFEYKNAESAQLLSDIMMFDEAGALEDLKGIINSSFDTSPEGVAELIESTSKEGEGPFMRGGNTISNEEIETIIKERKDYINSKIDSYIQDKDALSTSYPQLNNDALANVIFLKSQLADLSTRSTSIQTELVTNLQKLQESNLANKESLNIPLTTSQLVETLSDKSKATSLLNALNDSNYTLPFDEKQNIANQITDLYKINNGIQKVSENLTSLLSNPIQANDKADKNIEREKANTDLNKVKTKSVSELVNDESISPKQVAKEVRNNTIEDFDDATLQAIANAEEAGRIIDTYDNLTSELESLDVEDFVKDKAKRLIDAAKSSAESTNELLDIASEIYSDPSLLMSQDELQGLIAEGMSAEEIEAIHQSEYNRVIPYLNDVITKVLEDNKVADSVPEFDSNATEEVETVGYDQVSAIEEINKEDPEDLPTKEESVEEPTPDLTQQDFDSSNATSIDTESSENPYKYLRSGISQYPIYGREKGDFTEYADTLTANSPQNIRAKAIHSYLSNTGAYDRVNTGKVPVGTKIYFSIDPQLNDAAGSTVILLVNEVQEVVGVLPDKSETNASKYVGLIELINRIETSYNSLTSKTEISDTEKLNTLKEVKKIWDQQGTSIYKKVKENEDNFKNLLYFLTNPPTTKYYSSIEQELKKASITNPVFMEMYSKFSKNPSTEGTSFIYTNKGNKVYTTVAKNMIGRPLYTTYNNSSTLNAIHTVQDSNGNSIITPFTLSIAIKNGKNATLLMEPGTRSSQRLSDREMSALKPLDATKGMPYLAFPTSRKSKKGSVVTTQIPFSMPSFNDTTRESRLGKEIMSVLEDISKLKNDPNTIGKYVSKVKTFLSLPTLNINYLDNGDMSIRTTEGTTIIPIDNINGESFYSILKGSGFQVSRKYINGNLNGQSYNELIGELATANMLPGLTHTVNDWIAINPLDSNNKEIKATPPKTLGYNPNVEEAPVESTTSKKDKEEPTVTKYSFGSELLSNDRIDSKDVRVKKVLNNKNKKLMWDNLSGTQQAIIANRKGPIKTQIIEDLFRAYNVTSNSFDEVLLRGDVDTYLGIKGLSMEATEGVTGNSISTEISRIKKILPNIQFADSLVNGLIAIDKNSYAYGQFKKGIITLSNQAVDGAGYHEAFHAVSQTLLTDNEYQTLFAEAKSKYGNKSVLELEELLAEDFKEYMQYGESSWVGDVLKFFRRLKHLISNILGKDLYIDNLFYRISQGEFANRISNKSYDTSSIIQYHSNKLNFNNLNSTQLKYLKDKNITESEYSKFNDLQKEVLLKCIGI